MHTALSDLSLDHLWVVYPGAVRYQAHEKITVLPLIEIDRLPGEAGAATPPGGMKTAITWFMGRSDDVINTAGQLVSPFEVESALLEIDEVAESGVVGLPDELLFEKVVAFFVNLHAGISWPAELELKIRLHVSNRVSSLAEGAPDVPERRRPPRLDRTESLHHKLIGAETISVGRCTVI